MRGSDILSEGNHVCIDNDSNLEPEETHAKTTGALGKVATQDSPLLIAA